MNEKRLKELLVYNPYSGVFTWRVSKGRSKRGVSAGTVSSGGYVQIKLDGKRYLAHRLAWLYMTGSWPEPEIDHINRVRNDNRFHNLREATKQQNQTNKGLQKNNTSGFIGVSWCKRSNKWRSQIKHQGRVKTIGYYADKGLANQARLKEVTALYNYVEITEDERDQED